LLQASGFAPASIYLSDFVTLDDRVSCDDLAHALDGQVNKLGVDLGSTALIAHSTGAIITRRWLLDRRTQAQPLPSHFISCAGANHGSTLAQLGATQLAHIFRQLTEGLNVGQRVLQDLDYGSLFLRTLNRDWLNAWNDASAPLWREVYCFSMGGTDHSYWQNQLAWESHEAGSDGTVRISAANLNYRLIDLVLSCGVQRKYA
jgi:surfactin synthase thioesterase subunit